jgi:hypothetical protein
LKFDFPGFENRFAIVSWRPADKWKFRQINFFEPPYYHNLCFGWFMRKHNRSATLLNQYEDLEYAVRAGLITIQQFQEGDPQDLLDEDDLDDMNDVDLPDRHPPDELFDGADIGPLLPGEEIEQEGNEEGSEDDSDVVTVAEDDST